MSIIQQFFSSFRKTIIASIISNFNLYTGKTSFLMKAAGQNAGNNSVFVDSSESALVVSKTNKPTQGSFSPFSPNGWSGYFNGGSDYVSFSDASLKINSGAYTVEAWIYPTARTACGIFNYMVDGIDGPHLYLRADGTLNFTTYSQGIVQTSPAVVPLNQWSHVAITGLGSGAESTLWLNGVSLGTSIGNYNYTAQDFSISGSTAGARFIGNISNVKITIGRAIYTTEYTPATTDFVVESDTVLLTMQSNRFKDNSVNDLKYTSISGTPSVQLFSPFAPTVEYSPTIHGGSICTAKGDSLSVPASSVGVKSFSGDFTFEAWVYIPDSTIPNGHIYDSRENGSTPSGYVWGPASGTVSGMVLQFFSNSISRSGSLLVPYRQWTHIATVRSGTTLTHYVNGIADPVTHQLTGDVTGIASVNPIFLCNSKDNGLGNYGYIGYISSYRIINGTAEYSSDFIPTNSPAVKTANTSLLLNFTNANIVDVTSRSDILTGNTAKVTTLISKYNGKSVAFNGSNDYLYVKDNYALKMGSSDFTIEYWLFSKVLAASQIHVDFKPLAASTGGALQISNNASGTITVNGGTSAATLLFTSTLNLTTNIWNHISLVRKNNVVTLFVNGLSVGTTTDTTTYGLGALWVGSNAGATAGFLNGYIEDLRVTKGEALYNNVFTPSITLLPTITDTHFNKTILQLKTNDIDGGQNNTFIDSSVNALTVSRTGNVTQGSYSPFQPSGWSIGNTVGNQWAVTTPNTAALNINGGDFTVECWVKLNNWNVQQQTIWSADGASTNNPYVYIWNDNTIVMRSALTTGTIGASVPANIVLGRWFHLAICKKGTTVTLYKDGNALTSGTSSGLVVENKLFRIGSLAGNISNFRVVKGTALYDGAFVPPREKLTAITGTELLTGQDCQIKDNSNNNLALTFSSTTSVKPGAHYISDTDYSPITHGGSGYFDGTSNYLYIQNNPTFNYGTGDFTVSMWLNTLTTASRIFYDTRTTASSGHTLYTNASKIVYYANGGIRITSTTTMLTDSWYHIALVRQSGVTKLYINGIQEGASTSDLSTYTGGNLIIGGDVYNPTLSMFNGYLSDYHICKGIALYTSNFAVPNAPSVINANTSVLLKFNNASIYDVTGKNITSTIGTAKVSDLQSKIGTTSFLFNGTSDYIKCVDAAHFAVNNDNVTYEAWVYPISRSAVSILFSTDGGANTALGLYLNASGQLIASTYSSTIVSTTAVFPLNQWTHLACTVTNNTLKLWVNGAVVATAVGPFAFTSIMKSIGGQNSGSGAYYFNGYMDGIRITSSLSRYPFVPPIEAL